MSIIQVFYRGINFWHHEVGTKLAVSSHGGELFSKMFDGFFALTFSLGEVKVGLCILILFAINRLSKGKFSLFVKMFKIIKGFSKKANQFNSLSTTKVVPTYQRNML